MRIGSVASQLGISARTLRYYEQRGLVAAVERDDNGYRDFSAREVEQVDVLLGLRRLHVPLAAAADLARLCAAGQCDRVAQKLQGVIVERRREIASQAAHLARLDAELARLDTALAAGAEPRPLIRLTERRSDDV